MIFVINHKIIPDMIGVYLYIPDEAPVCTIQHRSKRRLQDGS
jgi:hypothetical protein